MPQAWLHALPKRPSVDPKVAHILGRPSRLPVQVACDAEHAQMTAIVIRVSILDQGGALRAPLSAVFDAAASARAGRAAWRPVPARRAAARRGADRTSGGGPARCACNESDGRDDVRCGPARNHRSSPTTLKPQLPALRWRSVVTAWL